jgi:hypothetical protein
MKKLIIPLVISAPLFFTTSVFAAPNATLYNPESRTDSTYSAGYTNTVPKAGTNYAYWHYRHWHRGHWHRWHHWHHWHRW